ncbi:Response regulator receiver protein [Planctomycetes bacterium Pan216]|uniref:Response regulator receiver protein n=1 Tax=Kolteria novifilia TaxID=2527975 RepID=A0A518B1K2_9BACT|nr:Response regulator receiver protein [Planctomycetes bacterium Pan216]
MTSAAARILVVDDDRDACENLRDILTEFDHEVDVCHDGQSALCRAGSRPFDIALIDLLMPGMDGLTFWRLLKQDHRSTVALLLTAHASDKTRTEARRVGIDRVVLKPIRSSALVQLLEEVLDRPLVLVVDDDEDTCESLWDVLADQGYRACWACDAQRAIEMVQSHPFRVILIDYKLGQEDNGRVVRSFRQDRPEARTILISSDPMTRDCLPEEAQKVGVDVIHPKPLDMEQLLDTVRAFSRSERNGMPFPECSP